MSIIPYVLLGIGIDVVIFAVIYSLRNKGPRMSYSEYKQKYGSIGPYSRSDASKYM